jgi:hypothetical protein
MNDMLCKCGGRLFLYTTVILVDIDCGGSATVTGNAGDIDAGGSVTVGGSAGDIDAGGSVRTGR